MTNFPSTVVNFLQKQDGVDTVVAADVNNPGNEISAIQTMLGAMGNTQAYSESYKNLLLHFRRGCKCIFNSSTAIYVNPGEIVIADGSGNYRFRRNSAQINVDFTMLDTGSKANSTVYYVYALADASGTTFTCCLSLNATTPTGHTFYRLIGTLSTDSSGNLIAGVVQNIYEFPALGEWQSRAGATVYAALTDGFVQVWIDPSVTSTTVIQSDGNVPPSAIRASAGNNAGAHNYNVFCSSFIRKNDYWSTQNATDTVLFIPIGL